MIKFFKFKLKKIKNLYLLFLCYIKFLFKGKANKKTAKLNKILVVQMSKLGDMVCTTPIFRAIKIKYPQAKIFVLGNSVNKQLLEKHPHVDKYIIAENSIFKNIKKIKQEKFDFACLIVPDFTSLTTIFLANINFIAAPKIIKGFSSQNIKPYKLLNKLVITKEHIIRHYAPKQYLKLLEPINIYSSDTKKYLNFSVNAKKNIEKFFQKNNIKTKTDLIIGITPTAGNKIKQWPAKRFAKLADYIYQKHKAKIILTASSQEQNTIQEVLKNRNPNTKIYNAKVNIDELKALISKYSMFISADTGPIYIAEAFKVPTIDIVGPVDENDQPPQGKYNLIVKADRKKSELYVMNARKYNIKEAQRQINDITINMVIEKFEELCKKLKSI